MMDEPEGASQTTPKQAGHYSLITWNSYILDIFVQNRAAEPGVVAILFMEIH